MDNISLGPRLSYRHLGRFTPFGQMLFGIDHATPNVLLTGNQTHFAMTLGGGLDYRLALSLVPSSSAGRLFVNAL